MSYTNNNATPRSDIHALVQQANADFNKLFIADKIFPMVATEVKLGTYMKAKLANGELMNADALPRSPGDGYNRVSRRFDVDTFNCQEYGLEEAIDDSYETEVSRFMQLEATTAALLERSLRISYERRVATLVTTTGSWTAGATNPTADYTEANLATINLPADVASRKAALLKYGITANAVVMSNDLYERVRRSTLMQNQIFGVVPKSAGQYTLPGEDDMARALGVDNLYVAKAPYNSAKKGQTFSGAFVWGNSYIWVGAVVGGDYSAGGAGRTISWTKDSTGGLFTPETYRDDSRRSNILRVRQSVTEKVIDETAGALITTNYS